MKRPGALLWLALLLAAPAPAAATPLADSSAAHAPLLTRRDVAFALASAGAIAMLAHQDYALRTAARAHDTPAAHDLARAAQPLGNAAVVAPALLVVDGLAHLAHRPAFAAATERVAFSVGIALIPALGIKLAAGRQRPFQSPTDDARFRSFSGDASFPSGHATLAFALAGALGGECHARWLPFATWPLAALVGWSRVHDDEHWTSDVVAGAALGAWTARKADTVARQHGPHGLWVVVLPHAGGAEARLGTSF